MDRTFISVENITWASFPIYPNCQYFDPYNYLELKNNTPLEIIFKFNKLNNVEVALYIEDIETSLNRRTLKSNFLAYSGSILKIKNLGIQYAYDQIFRINKQYFVCPL